MVIEGNTLNNKFDIHRDYHDRLQYEIQQRRQITSEVVSTVKENYALGEFATLAVMDSFEKALYFTSNAAALRVLTECESRAIFHLFSSRTINEVEENLFNTAGGDEASFLYAFIVNMNLYFKTNSTFTIQSYIAHIGESFASINRALKDVNPNLLLKTSNTFLSEGTHNITSKAVNNIPAECNPWYIYFVIIFLHAQKIAINFSDVLYVQVKE